MNLRAEHSAFDRPTDRATALCRHWGGGYHRRLKKWIERFHRVATTYLMNYLGWRRVLERYQRAIGVKCCLHEALGPHATRNWGIALVKPMSGGMAAERDPIDKVKNKTLLSPHNHPGTAMLMSSYY